MWVSLDPNGFTYLFVMLRLPPRILARKVVVRVILSTGGSGSSSSSSSSSSSRSSSSNSLFKLG